MPFSVVMPALEMAQETGKLLSWRKKEGDRVSKGEPLLEIETDKAVVEVEAPADGILAGVKATEGSEIPVGRTIAWIVAPGEAAPDETDSPAPMARAGSHANIAPLASTPSAPSPAQEPAGRIKISPKARRLAKDLGIEIASLRGSGSDGEVLASDVQAAHDVPRAPQTDSAKLDVPTSIGRIMADRTTQSWTTIPHFFVTREIDATGLRRYRDRMAAEIERAHNVRITHSDLLVALVARALTKHPRLNSSWTPEGIRLHHNVNIGIAIAVDDGVVAAVIHNAAKANLAEIAIQRRALTDRARAGKLRPADIADATFTISNLGMYQVDQFSAIITPPQAAILAVGSIADRVAAVEGKPAVKAMMTLTLSCDHRVADGARAALFLQDLADAASDPITIL